MTQRLGTRRSSRVAKATFNSVISVTSKIVTKNQTRVSYQLNLTVSLLRSKSKLEPNSLTDSTHNSFAFPNSNSKLFDVKS